MDILIRRPTLADVDRLAEINIESWRTAYAEILPRSRLDEMDPEAYRERWRLNIDEGRSGVEFFVAELDGVITGYSIAGGYRQQQDARPEDTAGWGEIYAIYVDPPWQGRGIGTALLDSALRWLEAQGHTEAALWVLEANAESRAWYAARGWAPDGETSLFEASGRRLPEVRMRRTLA